LPADDLAQDLPVGIAPPCRARDAGLGPAARKLSFKEIT
jgi:hypothetical protein